MNKKIYLFLMTILLPLLLISGFSSWILVGNTKVTIGIPTTSAVVCYNSKTNKEYRTIEKALGEAKDGETVYVYPDLNKEVVISQDCTIKTGVTLCLPYKDTTSYEETFGSVQAFADNDILNRKTLVIIEENVKVTI